MIRSVLAVLAGIAFLTVTSFAIEAAADPLLMRWLALPDRAALQHNGWAEIALFLYTSACVAGGGYVTAWLAPRGPIGHALILGGVQAGLTVIAMVSLREAAPMLNWILTIVLTVPVAWCGGVLRARA